MSPKAQQALDRDLRRLYVRQVRSVVVGFSVATAVLGFCMFRWRPPSASPLGPLRTETATVGEAERLGFWGGRATGVRYEWLVHLKLAERDVIGRFSNTAPPSGSTIRWTYRQSTDGTNWTTNWKGLPH